MYILFLGAGRAYLQDPKGEKAAEQAGSMEEGAKRRGEVRGGPAGSKRHRPHASALAIQIHQSWDAWPNWGVGCLETASTLPGPSSPLGAPYSQMVKGQKGHRKPRSRQ